MFTYKYHFLVFCWFFFLQYLRIFVVCKMFIVA